MTRDNFIPIFNNKPAAETLRAFLFLKSRQSMQSVLRRDRASAPNRDHEGLWFRQFDQRDATAQKTAGPV
jgi:hypothetical protein